MYYGMGYIFSPGARSSHVQNLKVTLFIIVPYYNTTTLYSYYLDDE